MAHLLAVSFFSCDIFISATNFSRRRAFVATEHETFGNKLYSLELINTDVDYSISLKTNTNVIMTKGSYYLRSVSRHVQFFLVTSYYKLETNLRRRMLHFDANWSAGKL